MDFIDPILMAKRIEKVVVQNGKRRYYRVSRPGRWYGGIATADCCGCNLRCHFCWSNKPRDNPAGIGSFYSSQEIAEELIKCARRYNYRYIRISGNEPTISKEHLLGILSITSKTNLLFILETNGTLLSENFIKDLKEFKMLHIRVSLKGTTPDEFSKLTSSIPESFEIIINNLSNLVHYNLRFNLAVMLSFSPQKNIERLKERLRKISPKIIEDFEEEYVFLYPHVLERLKKANLKPFTAYTPDGIPQELI